MKHDVISQFHCSVDFCNQAIDVSPVSILSCMPPCAKCSKPSIICWAQRAMLTCPYPVPSLVINMHQYLLDRPPNCLVTIRAVIPGLTCRCFAPRVSFLTPTSIARPRQAGPYRVIHKIPNVSWVVPHRRQDRNDTIKAKFIRRKAGKHALGHGEVGLQI
jgi:hypothetical protein